MCGGEGGREGGRQREGGREGGREGPGGREGGEAECKWYHRGRECMCGVEGGHDGTPAGIVLRARGLKCDGMPAGTPCCEVEVCVCVCVCVCVWVDVCVCVCVCVKVGGVGGWVGMG